jgi:hypothetical protein
MACSNLAALIGLQIAIRRFRKGPRLVHGNR